MLNPDLCPWNIFNISNDPLLGISGNVLIDGKEWYNAYMPCYFDLDDFNVISRLKTEIDKQDSDPRLISCSKPYLDYLRILEKYSENGRFREVVSSLKGRVNNYFNNVESKLFNVEFDKNDVVSLLAFVLSGLNLMQKYMDPVEALTTLKVSNSVPTLEDRIGGLGNMVILDRTPSSEVAYIPMVVLIESGVKKSESIKQVMNYYGNLFEIDQEALLESSSYANQKYGYTKYMSLGLAEKLISKTALKIDFLACLSIEDKAVYELQELNGIMTWSKNILTNKTKNLRRYDSTNNILNEIKETEFLKKNKKLTQLLSPKTTSGSEKQGMLIYLLKYIEIQNAEMYDQIKIKATQYYNLSKT